MKKHKSEKIHQVVHENDRDLNLHEIKAKTGAGNGYKHHSNTNSQSYTSNAFISDSKYDTIYKVVTDIEGKANLHKIKAQTGAGNGYAHNNSSKSDANITASENTATQHHSDATHKSHVIHAIFHANDRKLNLHEIKRKTGAGSGYKH